MNKTNRTDWTCVYSGYRHNKNVAKYWGVVWDWWEHDKDLMNYKEKKESKTS